MKNVQVMVSSFILLNVEFYVNKPRSCNMRKYLGFWGPIFLSKSFLVSFNIFIFFSTKFAFQTFRLLLHVVVLSFRFYEYTFKILGIKCFLGLLTPYLITFLFARIVIFPIFSKKDKGHKAD